MILCWLSQNSLFNQLYSRVVLQKRKKFLLRARHLQYLITRNKAERFFFRYIVCLEGKEASKVYRIKTVETEGCGDFSHSCEWPKPSDFSIEFTKTHTKSKLRISAFYPSPFLIMFVACSVLSFPQHIRKEHLLMKL